ncbi:glyoxalase [Litorimonas cladophorae]|uniref:Glyoxalase n=1 Tax=Litorimonas cladophorae TaxID=1220491 RepID=A0A918KGD4_9PROT|nr:VOC family protein [Litorimonas cladophorae]GGX60075.1 glyoxalase [Litorimonas cladophorae]
MSENHHKLHYIELPAVSVTAMKTFYGNVFGWTFTDYGPGYAAFHGAGVEGGFDESREYIAPHPAGVFVILYSDDLEVTEAAIAQAGGKISTPTYGFPGGRRFHFHDPSGNELGVWTEVKE